MTAGTGEPRVLALRCRACRTTLPAAANDIAFLCPQCGRAWEIEGHDLQERKSVHVDSPANPKYDLLYLPYWSFPVSTSTQPVGMGDEATLTARDRAAKMNRAFVSAYSIYRPTYVGEWGLVYTRLRPKWETRTGGGAEAPGAALNSRDARTIVHHYVLAEIDRAADLSKLEVNVELGAPQLWAIPCYNLGGMIRCPWTASELPAAMLDDLSEIRREAERREA